MTDLHDRAKQVLAAITAACDRQKTYEPEYVSEWLGWFPFGCYHHVRVGDDHDASRGFPDGWERADLERLVEVGCLEVLEELDHGTEPEDERVRYRLTERGRDLGRAIPSASVDDAARESTAKIAPPRETTPKPKRRMAPRWCHECGQEFTDPDKWSVGMCFSCSMDRSSEIFGDDD